MYVLGPLFVVFTTGLVMANLAHIHLFIMEILCQYCQGRNPA